MCGRFVLIPWFRYILILCLLTALIFMHINNWQVSISYFSLYKPYTKCIFTLMWLGSTSGMALGYFFSPFSFKKSLSPFSAAVADLLFHHTGIVKITKLYQIMRFGLIFEGSWEMCKAWNQQCIISQWHWWKKGIWGKNAKCKENAKAGLSNAINFYLLNL